MNTRTLLLTCLLGLIAAGTALAETQLTYNANVSAEAHLLAMTWGGQTGRDSRTASATGNNQPASAEVIAHAHVEEPQMSGSDIIADVYMTVRSQGGAAVNQMGATFASTLFYSPSYDWNATSNGASVASSNVSGTIVTSLSYVEFSGAKSRTGWLANYTGTFPPPWLPLTWEFNVLDAQSNLLLRLTDANPTGGLAITPGQPLNFSFITTAITSPAYPTYHSGVGELTDTVIVQMTPEPAVLGMFLLAGGLAFGRRRRRTV